MRKEKDRVQHLNKRAAYEEISQNRNKRKDKDIWT